MDADLIDRLRAMLADLRILAAPATNQPYDCNNENFSLDAAALEAAIAALSATPQAEQVPQLPVNLVGDLAELVNASNAASSVPLEWQALTEITAERAKEFVSNAVDLTVDAGCFSGEMHLVAEAESGLVVALTGCGEKSAANAQFLIGCAHFVMKHWRTLLATHKPQAAQVPVDLPASQVEWRLQRARAFVPEGYRLVPVEPTEAMLNEGGGEVVDGWDNDDEPESVAEAVWLSMLAAAQAQGVGRG